MKKLSILVSSLLLSIAANAADKPNSAALQSPDGEQSVNLQDPASKLSYDAQNTNESIDVRVKALTELAQYRSQNAFVAIARGLKDPSPQIREAAIIGSESYPLEYRWRMVSPLLTDDTDKVRVTAAINLARDYNNVNEEQREALKAPIKELKAYLSESNDGASMLLLADVLRWQNNWTEADLLYQNLLISDAENPQVWLNMADNYRAQNQDQQAINVLDNGIKKWPENAVFPYSKALALVRMGDKNNAAHEMEIATTLTPTNSYYWYLNGVLQEALDINKSTKSFEKAYLISGAPEQLYAVCDIYVRYGHEKADECLAELAKVAPSNVIEDLKAKKSS